jgi:hypothetical protein
MPAHAASHALSALPTTSRACTGIATFVLSLTNVQTSGDSLCDAMRCPPILRRGDVVIMDNLPAHKVVGVREAIEGVGAKLLFRAYAPHDP